tara:strand:+ start:450 stop:611 length:162 start_codon:yes stop_codon:yes gene_type:complete
MIFAIKPKKCSDYKDIINVDNKNQAIEYFSSKMKLEKNKLLEIYDVCTVHSGY